MRLFSSAGSSVQIASGGNTAAVFPALADGTDETENPLFVASGNLGFNGATLDMLRSEGNDRDAIAATTLGILESLGFLHGFNKTTWDRLTSEGNDRDAIAVATLGILETLGYQHGFNDTAWDRLKSEGNDRDAIGVLTLGLQMQTAFPHLFNATSWDRQRSLGTAALDGLGQMAVSLGIPGAGVAKTLLLQLNATTTRTTMITPASGKRIRILSYHIQHIAPTQNQCSLYFGTGTDFITDLTKVIDSQNLDSDQFDIGEGFVYGDGSGPVGAVDEVVSAKNGTSVGANTEYYVKWREE